nr:ABC-F family ATP-binding cassette domain-containing protein [Vallitaleaceae bacterium]
MALIQADGLSKSYGMKTLFKQIMFHIDENDRIGVVGINGTGKSTLLKILGGYESADSGNISKAKATLIEYLPQSPVFDDEATVLEQVLKGDSEIFVILRAYEIAVEKAHMHPENKAFQSTLLDLSEKMTLANGWELESQVKTILTRLQVSEFDKKINTLSGGERKRVALASALLSNCDLLILDEPTNHLDSDTIDWLEQYLGRRKGALLMVTHDRYFLDRVCNRIIELSHGSCYSYEGNYTTYVTAKAERLVLANVLEQRTQNLYKRELAWIRTGAKARATKQKARISRFEDLKKQEFITEQQNIDISVGFARMGKKTIILDNLGKGFNDVSLFSKLAYTFLPTDRLGVIGPNGAGKTTLLNIIAGQLEADYGTVDIGETMKIGYFSQEAKDMDITLRSIDYIKETAEYVETETGQKVSASQMMDKFLLTGEMQYAPISSLSGGERRRLYLLKVLMEAPNVLILDEPTNDLDIDTLKVLENYIDDFRGIVITVSHDRYFLNRVCNVIMGFEATGVVIYRGRYEDYLDYAKEQANQSLSKNKQKIREGIQKTSKDKQSSDNSRKDKNEKKEPGKKESAKKKLNVGSINNKVKNKQLKMSYKEKQELKNLVGVVERMMAELEILQYELENNKTDYTALQDIG